MSRRRLPLRAEWRACALDPQSPLSSRARLAAAVLAEHSTTDDGTLNYPPAARTLADWMGCSERTARTARQELVGHGFLIVSDRSGQTPRLRLMVPEFASADSAGVTGPTPAATPAGAPATTPATTTADSAAGTRGTSGTRGSSGDGALTRAHTGVVDERELGARQIVARYVAWLTDAQGVTAVPERLIGQLQAQVGQLVQDQVPTPVIRDALVLLHERRLHPSVLPSLVPEAELGPGRRTSNDHIADVLFRETHGFSASDLLNVDHGDGT